MEQSQKDVPNVKSIIGIMREEILLLRRMVFEGG
jgi:hypothetical protein